RALDVVRAPRSMDQAERRPDRMVAAEDEGVTRAAKNCLHAAPVRFDPGRAWIVKSAAVHRAPERRIQLEVRAAPLRAHGVKHALEMFLRTRMRAVEREPGSTPPATEGDAIGSQRRACFVFDEPVGMLLENGGGRFGDERCDPDRRLEAALVDLLEDAAHVAPERRAGVEPVAHRTLIPIVNLHVLQSWD